MLQQPTFDFIPDIHPKLFSAILDGNVVVFVGNGVSRLVGVPSWQELAYMFLDDWFACENTDLSYDAYEKLKLAKTDPLELLTICAGKIGKDKLKKQLFDKLQGKLTEKNIEKIREIYKYIRDFRAGYITTNYDDFLETSIPSSNMLSNQENKLDKNVSDSLTRVGLNDSLQCIKNKIVYLHGKAVKPGSHCEDSIPNKIILTLEDYLEHYKDKEGLGKEFLSHIFAEHVFLFIGFGLREFEIIQHIQRPDISHTHYILLGASDYEYPILEQYKKYYSLLNITPIFYNMSKKGYHQLESVLAKWSLDIRTARKERLNELKCSQKNIENLRHIRSLGNGIFR